MLGAFVAQWSHLAANAAFTWLVYKYSAPKPSKRKQLEQQFENIVGAVVSQWTQLAANAALAWWLYKCLAPKPEATSKREELEKRLGRSLIKTTPMEDEIACNVVDPEQIDVVFDSVGGLKAVKQALFEQVILPLQRPELFPHKKFAKPRKGVLLYGPAGTGKTMLSKVIAKESGAVFINVKISNLINKRYGDLRRQVAAIFSLASKLQPAIIFLDDVDNFLGLHRCIDRKLFASMRTEFMDLWDSFTREHNNARVMILATTKNPSELDEEVMKSLPQAFEIGLPDHKERAEILKLTLKGEYVEDNIDYNHIAGMCQGFSGSDLLEVCNKAAYFPVRELLAEEKNGKPSPGLRPLSQPDLEKALVQYQGCKE